ncbi:hypothetical protein [Foetidibacter luteolus]|uniref:hypothetical protein n=1 Tax=Foetidibacter luteolus TaxID=2608880 RepID=UPI00129A7842|nr:hypothetical protein [Foetidibacter luteolus]
MNFPYLKICLPMVVLCLAAANANAQRTRVSEPDFAKLSNDKKVKPVNREMSLSTEADYKNGIHLNEQPGVGVTWLPKPTFSNGTIEFDVKGKDVPQQSFVGIAFHGKNDSTYDAVYFRPFNFKSSDTARKNHSVQYIAMPLYDWPTLRSRHPGVYEDSLYDAPDPNGWFHVSILIQSPTISVFVNRNKKASLVVKKLNERNDGKIGFWVGNGSGGDFANLKLTEMME